MKQPETDTPFWVSMPIIRNIVMSAAMHEKDLEAICHAGGTRLYDYRIEVNETEARCYCEPVPLWNELFGVSNWFMLRKAP